jgi:ABC-2 type transport system permease protein
VSDLRLVFIQTKYQLRSLARTRRAVIFTIVFPPLLLVLFNSIFVGGADTVKVAGVDVEAHAYFTGGILAYSILLAGFTQLAITLVTDREDGRLKRYRGTPVPSWTFIVATVLRAVTLVGVMSAVLLLIARFAYGVSISGAGITEVILFMVLGTATMCSLGMAVTSIASDVDTAGGMLPVIALVVSFISGIFVPVDLLPTWLADVGRVLPLYHLVEGLQTAIGAGGQSVPVASNVLVLCAWTLAGIVVATRRFRWEPQAAAAR